MTEPNQQKHEEKIRHTMQPMTIRGFVKAAEVTVEKAKANMATKLARGSCPNMEQYNRECGRMEGMEQAVVLLKDMLGQLEEAERNADLPEMES